MDLDKIPYDQKHYFINTSIYMSRKATSSEDPGKALNISLQKQLEILKQKRYNKTRKY